MSSGTPDGESLPAVMRRWTTGFGQETHFCMGYALARQEAVVASRILLEALRNPRLADVPNEGIAFPPPGRGGVRGLQHLDIEFDLQG